MNLKECYLFEGFADKELSELSSISFEKKFASGEVIFIEGDSSKYLHVLLEGRVDIYKANAKFGEFFLHSIDAPSLVAELPTFERIAFPASARAATKCSYIKNRILMHSRISCCPIRRCLMCLLSRYCKR